MKKPFLFGSLAVFCLCLQWAPATGQGSFVNGVTQNGVSINCDLPDSQQMKNIGSKVDGAGMCVFTSIEMAARYQGLEQMRGWRDWCAQYPGGGYPQKVDDLLAKWFKTKGIKPIPYLQFEGKDPEQLMARIDKTNRMACVTYGFSPRYGRGLIYHMTDCVLYRSNYGVVLDNNFIGDKNYEWMSQQELIRRMKLAGGSAWVFVWLTPGSPPPPKAKK
jgi:hypothetical protein